MIIEHNRFVLRPWKLSDAKELAYIANNRLIENMVRDGFPQPYTEQDADEWLLLITGQNSPTQYFAIIVDDIVAGSIAIVLKDNIYKMNAEIGYFLGEEYWNKGIMTDVVKEISKYAFKTFKLHRLYAEPFDTNIGSKRVLEKAGYHLEATLKDYAFKNEAFVDCCIYSLFR